MNLQNENITELQALYKKEFGVELSKEDAYEKGVKLLKLMSFVYKPITEEEYESIQQLNYSKNGV